MDDPKVEGLALFTRKNGNFLYRDEGDQQKLSKRSINLTGQGHSLFFSLTADNFRYNQNNTLSVRSQLTLNFIHRSQTVKILGTTSFFVRNE